MYILNRVKELKKRKVYFSQKAISGWKEALLRIMKALPRKVMGIPPGLNATMRVVERV